MAPAHAPSSTHDQPEDAGAQDPMPEEQVCLKEERNETMREFEGNGRRLEHMRWLRLSPTNGLIQCELDLVSSKLCVKGS